MAENIRRVLDWHFIEVDPIPGVKINRDDFFSKEALTPKQRYILSLPPEGQMPWRYARPFNLLFMDNPVVVWDLIWRAANFSQERQQRLHDLELEFYSQEGVTEQFAVAGSTGEAELQRIFGNFEEIPAAIDATRQLGETDLQSLVTSAVKDKLGILVNSLAGFSLLQSLDLRIVSGFTRESGQYSHAFYKSVVGSVFTHLSYGQNTELHWYDDDEALLRNVRSAQQKLQIELDLPVHNEYHLRYPRGTFEQRAKFFPPAIPGDPERDIFYAHLLIDAAKERRQGILAPRVPIIGGGAGSTIFIHEEGTPQGLSIF